MELYFSPLACSMASRIALYEAGAAARFIEVDTAARKTLDGADYRAVHPLGVVPALRRDDGEVLTENAAILQSLVDQHPQAELGPRDGLARIRLQQWLSFVGTEMHKGIFMPLLNRSRGRREGGNPRQGKLAPQIPQRLSDRTDICARSILRRRRIPGDDPQLAYPGACRPRGLAGDCGLFRAHQAASERRSRHDRRERAVRREAAAQQVVRVATRGEAQTFGVPRKARRSVSPFAATHQRMATFGGGIGPHFAVGAQERTRTSTALTAST